MKKEEQEMLRAAFSKVMWVGRATTLCVGFTVILAVVFGVGATALAAVPGDPFKLGRFNTVDQLTSLAGSVDGPLLKVDNNGSGPVLALEAETGNPPLKVNANAGKATNLNADKLDGEDASAFLGVGQKAADADKLDGNDSVDFYSRGEKVADSSHADEADSAKKAGNADTLDGMDSGRFQPRLSCPTGTMLHEGACIETTRRGLAAFSNAEAVCLQAGRRLPTVAELQTFRLRQGQDFNAAEYTSHVWLDTNGAGATYKIMLVDRTGAQDVTSSGGTVTFRCVAALGVTTFDNNPLESVVQGDLRNASIAASACANDDNGSYANCGSIARLEAYGYERSADVMLRITTATTTRWVAQAQHNAGGKAYQYDSVDGEVEPVPRF